MGLNVAMGIHSSDDPVERCGLVIRLAAADVGSPILESPSPEIRFPLRQVQFRHAIAIAGILCIIICKQPVHAVGPEAA